MTIVAGRKVLEKFVHLHDVDGGSCHRDLFWRSQFLKSAKIAEGGLWYRRQHVAASHTALAVSELFATTSHRGIYSEKDHANRLGSSLLSTIHALLIISFASSR